MYEDLLEKRIIVELKNLVDKSANFADDIDSYAEFMKQVILNTYTAN